MVDALGKEGVKVSVSLITNVKSKHNKRRQVVKKTVAKADKSAFPRSKRP